MTARSASPDVPTGLHQRPKKGRTTMTAATKAAALGRDLLSPELFDKLASRVTRDAHLDYELAERVVDQTLAFLAACSQFRGRKLSPSNLVDIGWHTFILDTVEYLSIIRSNDRFGHLMNVSRMLDCGTTEATDRSLCPTTPAHAALVISAVRRGEDTG